jgi:hypothetical protein
VETCIHKDRAVQCTVLYCNVGRNLRRGQFYWQSYIDKGGRGVVGSEKLRWTSWKSPREIACCSEIRINMPFGVQMLD